MSAPRLDKATKDKIVAAYLAGDKIADIARTFGVDASYPRLLTRRRGHLGPTRKAGRRSAA